MTYIVQKIDAGRWQLSNELGTNLGVFASRNEAKTTGALLAGWRGSVVVR
jgi:hypothetical protein